MVKTGMGRRTALMGFSAILLAGCAATGMPTKAPPGNAAAGAQAAFEAALRGYEQENLKPLEALLPARFTGRSLLLESAQAALNEQKQIRIRLSEFQLQGGTADAGNAQFTARWDKRFLRLPGLVPGVETGSLQAQMRLEAGRWVLESLSSDNPFSR